MRFHAHTPLLFFSLSEEKTEEMSYQLLCKGSWSGLFPSSVQQKE